MKEKTTLKWLMIVALAMIMYLVVLRLVSTGVITLPPMPTPVGTPIPYFWYDPYQW